MFAEAMVQEMDVRQLIRQPEGPPLEFKTYTPDVAKITEVLSSFANTDGGTLVGGVRDGSEVGGERARLLRAVEEARRRMRPSPEVRMDTPTIDGKHIGIVRIGRSAEAPVFADAGIYGCEGSQARPMTARDLTERIQHAERPLDNADLAQAIANQTALIEVLQAELGEANGWKSKLKEYLVGDVIGAILAASVLVDRRQPVWWSAGLARG